MSDEKKPKSGDPIIIGDHHTTEVLELLHKVVGEENVHVIRTQQDIDDLAVEMELREYLKSGGRLN